MNSQRDVDELLGYYQGLADRLPGEYPRIIKVKFATIPADLRSEVKGRFPFSQEYRREVGKAMEKQAEDRGGIPRGTYREGQYDFGVPLPEFTEVVPELLLDQLRLSGFKISQAFWFEKPRQVPDKQRPGQTKTLMAPLLTVVMSCRTQDKALDLGKERLSLIWRLARLCWLHCHVWLNEDGVFPSDEHWTGELAPFRVDTINLGQFRPATKDCRYLGVFNQAGECGPEFLYNTRPGGEPPEPFSPPSLE